MYVVSRGDGKAKELAFLASKEEVINDGGVEMMIRLETWVYWYKKN